MDKLRRDRKNWFYSYNIVFDLKISMYAKLIYLYLCRCSDEGGESFPSYKIIQEKCDIGSRATVSKSIKELEQIGLLEKENRKTKSGGKTSNLYIVHDTPCSSDELPHVHQVNYPCSPDELPHVHQVNYPCSPDEHEVLSNQGLSNFKDYPSIHQTEESENEKEKKEIDGLIDNTYSEVMSNLKERFSYNVISKDSRWADGELEEMINIICETLCNQDESIKIGRDNMPARIVKSALMKLDIEHLEYVSDCMAKNTTKIHNIKAYILKSLYNAPSTINHYYRAEVNHKHPQYANV